MYEYNMQPSVHTFKRGEFIEETFGQKSVKDIAENGIQRHDYYGTYLVWIDVRK
jgi:hypothetical protein